MKRMARKAAKKATERARLRRKRSMRTTVNNLCIFSDA